MINALQVTVHFSAKPSFRDWMVITTMDAHCSSQFVYLRFQRTTIRAIMWTRTINCAKFFALFDLNRRFGGHILSFQYTPLLINVHLVYCATCRRRESRAKEDSCKEPELEGGLPGHLEGMPWYTQRRRSDNYSRPLLLLKVFQE